MKLHESLSISYGGSINWFQPMGGSSIPAKLHAFSIAGLKLAHQPWEFGVAEVKGLLRLCSIQEVVCGLVILSEYHALSSFILGLGVSCEYDQPFKELSFGTSARMDQGPSKGTKTITSRLRGYNYAISEEANEATALDDWEDEDNSSLERSLQYVNFVLSRLKRRLYPSDFTWRDHGYAILDRLCPNLAEHIENTIEFAASMTFSSIFDERNINTEPFRRAIWKYTHRVYGLVYDDYNYQEVNVFLLIEIKKYLKKVACEPDILDSDDFDGIDTALKPQEIVHVNLLIAEARVEAQLLYVTAAIQQMANVT